MLPPRPPQAPALEAAELQCQLRRAREQHEARSRGHHGERQPYLAETGESAVRHAAAQGQPSSADGHGRSGAACRRPAPGSLASRPPDPAACLTQSGNRRVHTLPAAGRLSREPPARPASSSVPTATSLPAAAAAAASNSSTSAAPAAEVVPPAEAREFEDEDWQVLDLLKTAAGAAQPPRPSHSSHRRQRQQARQQSPLARQLAALRGGWEQSRQCAAAAAAAEGTPGCCSPWQGEGRVAGSGAGSSRPSSPSCHVASGQAQHWGAALQPPKFSRKLQPLASASAPGLDGTTATDTSPSTATASAAATAASCPAAEGQAPGETSCAMSRAPQPGSAGGQGQQQQQQQGQGQGQGQQAAGEPDAVAAAAAAAAATEALLEHCRHGRYEEVREALRAAGPGAVEAVEAATGRTPLLLACAGGHGRVIKLLLRKGARVNAQDRVGCTALHLSVLSGHSAFAIARHLLAAGADAAIRNAGGLSAADMIAGLAVAQQSAAQQGAVQPVEQLEEQQGGAGADTAGATAPGA